MPAESLPLQGLAWAQIFIEKVPLHDGSEAFESITSRTIAGAPDNHANSRNCLGSQKTRGRVLRGTILKYGGGPVLRPIGKGMRLQINWAGRSPAPGAFIFRARPISYSHWLGATAEMPAFEMAIADDEVHVWTLDLDRAAPDYSVLSPEEQAREARLVKTEDRRRFAAAHVAVRQILGRYEDAAPGALVFEIDEVGKPHLATPDQPGLAFSLSHSAGRGLLAVAGGGAVGVDIEMMRPLDNLPGMAREIMSDTEWAGFQPLLADPAGSGAAHDAFFTLWVRKEAVLKAGGTGFMIDPRTLHIGLGPGRARVVWRGTSWSIVPLAVGPLAKAAVAAAGSWPLVSVFALRSDNPESADY
jgi:4'-phosphopantetheinyl transferase